jgi:hypothetical protein
MDLKRSGHDLTLRFFDILFSLRTNPMIIENNLTNP